MKYTIGEGFAGAELKQLRKENAELKMQIAKMSNCLNCAFWKDKKYNVCREIKKLGKTCCTFWKLEE